MRTELMPICVVLSALSAAFGFASPAPAATPDPGFTYQGVLHDGSAPADGPYDLRFRLYDDETGGAELGLVTIDDHEVIGGRFTALLDFGDPFDGRALWLELEVRPGSSSAAYATLAPRQPLTAAAFVSTTADAGHATTAGSAASAGDADTLDGEHGSTYRAWSNLIGVPPGLDDGDDDVLAGLACADGEVATWDGTAWSCDADDGVRFRRTVVVAAASADPLVNGAALLAAVDSLPAAASQSDAWRVRLEPGLYDLGVEALQLPPWTLLEGSGQRVTFVSSAICGPSGIPVGSVQGSHDVELRDLAVANICGANPGSSTAVSFGHGDTNVRLTRVFAVTLGGAERCAAVFVPDDGAVLERVTAESDGCPVRNTGIAVYGDDVLVLDCVSSATGGGIHHALIASGRATVNRGSYHADYDPAAGGSAIKIEASAELIGASASSDDVAITVNSFGDHVVTMSRMGIDGRVDAYAGTGATLSLLIEHSTIASPGVTVEADDGVTVGIAATQLSGLAVDPNGGTIVCAGVWDEGWAFSPTGCP